MHLELLHGQHLRTQPCNGFKFEHGGYKHCEPATHEYAHLRCAPASRIESPGVLELPGLHIAERTYAFGGHSLQRFAASMMQAVPV